MLFKLTVHCTVYTTVIMLLISKLIKGIRDGPLEITGGWGGGGGGGGVKNFRCRNFFLSPTHLQEFFFSIA